MASSRRTSPTQPSRQGGGTHKPNEEMEESNVRMQKERDPKEWGEKKRAVRNNTETSSKEVITR